MPGMRGKHSWLISRRERPPQRMRGQYCGAWKWTGGKVDLVCIGVPAKAPTQVPVNIGGRGTPHTSPRVKGQWEGSRGNTRVVCWWWDLRAIVVSGPVWQGKGMSPAPIGRKINKKQPPHCDGTGQVLGGDITDTPSETFQEFSIEGVPSAEEKGERVGRSIKIKRQAQKPSLASRSPPMSNTQGVHQWAIPYPSFQESTNEQYWGRAVAVHQEMGIHIVFLPPFRSSFVEENSGLSLLSRAINPQPKGWVSVQFHPFRRSLLRDSHAKMVASEYSGESFLQSHH